MTMTVEKLEQLAATLEAAAREFSKPDGWTRRTLGAYDQAEGAVCAGGALYRTTGADGVDARYTEPWLCVANQGVAVAWFLREGRGLPSERFAPWEPWEEMVEFNDAPGRTQMDVVVWLMDRAALVRLEAERLTALKTATMADIGEESPRVVEFEPMPAEVPLAPPVTAPAPQRVPEPAPSGSLMPVTA